MKVIWTGNARENLDAIWLFVAQDNIDAADALMDIIRGAAVLLEHHPKAGRSSKIRGMREFVVSGTPYILLYRIADRTVQILGVILAAKASSRLKGWERPANIAQKNARSGYVRDRDPGNGGVETPRPYRRREIRRDVSGVGPRSRGVLGQ